MQFDDDDRLVQRTLAGDATAYGALVDRYRMRILNLTYRMLGDRERAEDAAQEAFIRAYRGLKSYRPSGRFSAWLFATASNLCIDRLRQRPFAHASLDEPSGRPEPSDERAETDPPAAYGRSETQEQVHRALGRLPGSQRLAIALVHLQGLSYEEAAEVMGVPVGTVKSHAHRARTALKRLLSPHMQECSA
ncbi:MAG: sigma-70 family RNA polymerase sigma factor [Armatimonadetes bacterium]|nr:sigma-70 family RNA polymerase sigma factor [Armatimonadota bacterium]